VDTLSDAQIAGGMKTDALETVRKALALNPPGKLKTGLQAKLSDLLPH
jgi:hypothetical protein